jgi:predicted amidohydrolase YtcJ
LDQDPFKMEPHDLQHVKSLATMVGGDWVWRV